MTTAGASLVPSRPRPWQPQWWLPEKRRGLTSGAATLLLGVPIAVLRTGDASSSVRRGVWDFLQFEFGLFTVLFLGYLPVYVVLTMWAFRGTSDADCLAWARSTRRGTPIERWIYATDPGAGVATVVAFVALVASLSGHAHRIWGEGAPEWVGTAGTIALAVLAWISVVLTYSIDYLCRDQRSDGPHLSFPGGVRGWRDYVYFSVAATTTFGATDVTVESSSMRSNVTTHALIAFVFNTVILAVVIGQFA